MTYVTELHLTPLPSCEHHHHIDIYPSRSDWIGYIHKFSLSVDLEFMDSVSACVSREYIFYCCFAQTFYF